MNNIIKLMLSKFKCVNTEQRINAIREVFQEIILACLSKTNFFLNAAFFGGTALRIFYNLDRYSEDLDFVLIKPNKGYSFEKNKTKLIELLNSYGLDFAIELKSKNIKTNRITYYAKTSIKKYLRIYFNDPGKSVDKKRLLNIKIEIDINPPKGAIVEHKYKDLPFPYQVTLYDASTLFATKINAILTRNYKTHIKGRDLYDLLFYLKNNTPFNIKHLKNRLIRENYIKSSRLTLEDVKDLLINKFNSIIWLDAIIDVMPLINQDRIDEVNLWSKDYFIRAIANLNVK